MPKLTIDNQPVEVSDGSTILDAARKLGIDIPTLCYLKGCSPSTSCMACVVRINGQDRLSPACATRAAEGMQIESETDAIRSARRAALDLLLSDHPGDCEGPCHSVCPARMNIPRMIRQIAAGQTRDALITVKQDIALPAALGRICPAPCEKGCRRTACDDALAICVLKRYVADADLASDNPYLPSCKPASGKYIAIVGAGPTGLAAAWHLLQEGHACTIYDEHDKPGGTLQYTLPVELLSRKVLDAEIALTEKLGAQFKLSTNIGDDISFTELQNDYDAVVIAVGQLTDKHRRSFNLETTDNGFRIDKTTYRTYNPKVFVGGSAVSPRKMAVRSVADGKAIAASIDQFLTGVEVTGPHKPFTTHISRLNKQDVAPFLVEGHDAPRTDLQPTASQGLTDDQARREAGRCLHCDCRKPDNCKLRIYADKYEAKATRYKGPARPFVQYREHADVIYEPGKCISCGLCIQIAARAGEPLGLSFIGRGFDVRVGVPFNHTVADALQKTAQECAQACPTGALVKK